MRSVERSGGREFNLPEGRFVAKSCRRVGEPGMRRREGPRRTLCSTLRVRAASLPGTVAYPRLQQQRYGNAELQSGATVPARLLLFEVDDFEMRS